MHPDNRGPSVATTQTLTDLRNHLIRLHKTLLDIERRSYERMHGRKTTPAQFFELVVSDEWFAWLRPISELIVRIDELLAEDGVPDEEDARAILERAEDMLTPAEMGTSLQRRYYEALQMEPSVVMAHADAVRVIRGANPSREE